MVSLLRNPVDVISGLCALDILLLWPLPSWEILFSWFPWHRAVQNLGKVHLKIGSNSVPSPRSSMGQTSVLVSSIGGMAGWDEMELDNAPFLTPHFVIWGENFSV